MKMNERESCLVTGDTDLYNFEKRLREALHELNLKRVLLEESRKELNQALLVKYELERRLDRACRELEESRVQLELAVSTGRKWEEEREAVPLHRAHLQWKTSLQEMESRLKNSEDRSEKLQQALNSALESSEKFWKDAKEREKETKKMKEAKEAIEQELDELKRKKEQKDVEIQVEFSKEENDVPENNTKEDDDSKSKSVSLENRNEEIEKE